MPAPYLKCMSKLQPTTSEWQVLGGTTGTHWFSPLAASSCSHPSLGLLHKALHWTSDKLMLSWEHWWEQLYFAPLIWLTCSCRCKVRLMCSYSKDNLSSSWHSTARTVEGLAVRRLAASAPSRIWAARVCLPAVCNLFCSDLDMQEHEKCQGCMLILYRIVTISGNKSFHMWPAGYEGWMYFTFSFGVVNIEGTVGSSMAIGSREHVSSQGYCLVLPTEQYLQLACGCPSHCKLWSVLLMRQNGS